MINYLLNKHPVFINGREPAILASSQKHPMSKIGTQNNLNLALCTFTLKFSISC